MEHVQSQPPAPLLALIPGGLVALSLLHPASAYPGIGLVVSSLWILALALAGRATVVEFRVSKAGAAAFAILLAMPLLWLLSLQGAPLAAAGQARVVDLSLASVVAVACAMLAGGWRGCSRRVLMGVLVVLSVEAAFSVYQVIGHASMPRTFASLAETLGGQLRADDPLREGLLHALAEGRAMGSVGAPNILATFMAAGLVLGAGLAIGERAVIRWACVAGALLCGWALVLTGSRGGLLAGAAGVSALAFLLCASRLNEGLRRRAAALLLVAVLAGAGLLLGLIFSIDAESRWLNVSGMKQRFLYWAAGAAMWREAPFFGLGPGAFSVLYPQYRLAGANETIRAHSFLVEMGVSTGIVGVGLFVGLCGLVLCLGWRQVVGAGASEPRGAALPAAMAAAIALLVHGLVEYSLEFREAVLLLAVLLGLVLGESQEGEADRALQVAVPWRTGSLLAALAALAVVFVYQARPAKAEAAKEAAIALMESGAPVGDVMAELERAIKSQPGNPTLFDLRAHVREQAGDLGGAMADLELAIKLNPYSAQLRERRALLLESLGRRADALSEQRAAVALHPLDAMHRMTLAEMLERGGDRSGAVVALESTRPLLLISEREQVRRRALERLLGIAESP